MQANESIQQAPYLTFSIGDEHYGVGVLAVREILEYEAITRVPRAPAYVRGVINLRGRVVPIVDLAVRFGMPASPVTNRSCIVIAEARLDGETVVMGLVVDSVSQVIELLPGEMEAPPSFGTRADVAYLEGLGRAGQGFVLLLDIDRVLSPVEVGQVATLDLAEGDGARAGAPASSGGPALATVASTLEVESGAGRP